MTRQLELWVQLMELNEAGEFAAVEVLPAKDIRTGGIFQLRQVSWIFVCLYLWLIHFDHSYVWLHDHVAAI